MSVIINLKNKKGFTLIELLVVISIIGLLSSLVFAAVTTARIKARDTKRLSDVALITKALELYFSDKGYYPPNSEDDSSGWDTSSCDFNGNGKYFIEALETQGYMKVPRDPLSVDGVNCSGGYKYYRYSAGASTCDPSRGDFYVLAIKDLELSVGESKDSPQFYCPSRNWNTEGEWVTGRYTN